jgi:predicted MFS family arabinose efflux permease
MRETIFLLALAGATSGIALRVVEPMLPRLADDFATTISGASTAITAFALAYMLGQLIYGPLGDRFGKLRVVTLSMFGAALGSIGCALAQDLGSLTALRFLTALFASSPVSLGMAYIGDQVPIAERQPVIARFVAGTIIGQTLGPLIGGVSTDLLGWRGTFVFVGAMFAVVSAILFLRTGAQWAGSGSVGTGGNPYTAHLRLLAIPRVRYVAAASFTNTFFFFGAYSFLGAFLGMKFELNLTLIGALLAGVGLGSLLYTLVVNRLLHAIGQRGLVAWGGAICCGCYALTVLAPVWEIAIPSVIGIGFSFYMLQNTLQAKASEMAPQARAAGVSTYVSFWSLGQAAGVGTMGLAVGLVGYTMPIIAFGLGYFALGLWLRGNLQRLS